MAIGFDLIDRQFQESPRHSRAISRIQHPDEQINDANYEIYWAAKEAAYKFCCNQGQPTGFIPRAFCYLPTKNIVKSPTGEFSLFLWQDPELILAVCFDKYLTDIAKIQNLYITFFGFSAKSELTEKKIYLNEQNSISSFDLNSGMITKSIVFGSKKDKLFDIHKLPVLPSPDLTREQLKTVFSENLVTTYGLKMTEKTPYFLYSKINVDILNTNRGDNQYPASLSHHGRFMGLATLENPSLLNSL